MTIRNRVNRALRVAFGTFLLVGALSFDACTPELTDDPIPFVPFDDVIINVSLPQYSGSFSAKGYIYLNEGGVRGLIVYRVNPSTYVVFERNCSYMPNEVGSTVEVHVSTLYMHDPSCGSTFQFPGGEPSGGSAWRPLRQYGWSLDGTFLTITDEVVNP